MLSCRRKDDIPAQLPADDGLVHESQSSETVIDDIMTDVNVLRIEDGRSREHNSALTAILCQCRSVCSR